MPVDIDADKMEDIKESGETWIIDFWAGWCKPCEKYAPVFEEVSGEMEDFEFGKVDMEENQEIGTSLGVRALPTTVIVEGGDEVARKSGVLEKEELREWIEDNA